MNHRALVSGLSLLFSLQGCGAALSTHTGGSVSLSAHGDPNAIALGSAAINLAQGSVTAASVNTNTAVNANVNAPSAPVATRVVVAQVLGLRVHAAGQGGQTQTLTGGAVAIELPGSVASSDIVSGDLEIDASAVEGAASTVLRGTVTLASGVQLPIGGGRVTLARAGSGWILSSGRITTTTTSTTTTSTTTAVATNTSGAASGTGVGIGAGGGAVGAAGSSAAASTTTTSTTTTRVTGVDVSRVTVTGGAQVVAGGEITITGGPSAQDLEVVDGSIEFADSDLQTSQTSASRTARVTVRATARRTIRVRAGGRLLVSDRRGHRWRVRVDGGELLARTDGSNPSGRVVWQPLGGELNVTVLSSGGESLTLDGAGLPEATVQLTPRVRAALDTLVSSVPSGSREAGRLAAAVEVVLRNAESAEPSFYAIPVRGRSLVLMVDISYSMSDPDPQGSAFAVTPSKLDVARAELVKVLASVPQGVQVNVVAFSSQVHTLWTASRTMDDASLAEAVRWVAALRPADETHPLEALQAATAFNPDQIVLLSDGRPSDSDAVLRDLLARVDAIAARTRVDVVGFGADQDRQFLTSLAAHGHGTLRLR